MRCRLASTTCLSGSTWAETASRCPPTREDKTTEGTEEEIVSTRGKETSRHSGGMSCLTGVSPSRAELRLSSISVPTLTPVTIRTTHPTSAVGDSLERRPRRLLRSVVSRCGYGRVTGRGETL